MRRFSAGVPPISQILSGQEVRLILGEEVRRFDLIVDNSGEERIADSGLRKRRPDGRSQKSGDRSRKSGVRRNAGKMLKFACASLGAV